MSNLKVKDYVRLAKQSSTVAREFERFKKDIFVHTLKWEGGNKLHNVPGDSGGWTLWGIAFNHNKQTFDNFDDFKDTTYEEAAAIAYIKYYRAVQAFILPPEAQLMYFDMAYNMGNNRAIRIMQECAGFTGSQVDGIIGPATRERMGKITEDCLYQKRNTFYNNLVAKNGTLRKFLRGWMNRSKAIFNV
jgi:lysozyme family protein